MILHLIRPLHIASAGLVLGALIAALAACGQARAARQLEIAVQDDPVFLGDGYRLDRERAFKYLQALGVTRLRVNLAWATAMPPRQYKARRKPASINWEFSAYDAMVDVAAERGIRVHAALTGPAPVWASGNRKLRGGVRPNARYWGVRGDRREALQGSHRPLQHLERAELANLAPAAEERPAALSRPLYARIRRDQAR